MTCHDIASPCGRVVAAGRYEGPLKGHDTIDDSCHLSLLPGCTGDPVWVGGRGRATGVPLGVGTQDEEVEAVDGSLQSESGPASTEPMVVMGCCWSGDCCRTSWAAAGLSHVPQVLHGLVGR